MRDATDSDRIYLQTQHRTTFEATRRRSFDDRARSIGAGWDYRFAADLNRHGNGCAESLSGLADF